MISFRHPSQYSQADVAALTGPRVSACYVARNGDLLRAGSNTPCRPNEHRLRVVGFAVVGGAALGLGMSRVLHVSDMKVKGEPD
jgi:hypothetical protein